VQRSAPSSEVRLARGLTPPRVRSTSLEGSRPPSSGVRLARGLTPPSSGVRLARGLTPPPRAGFASLEGSHARLFPPARTSINALTPQGRANYSETPGNRAPALFRQRPRGNPSPPLWGTVRRGWCQLRDTVPPTPVRLTRCTLEGGPAAPSNVFPVPTQGQTMTSGRRERHPHHHQPCAAIFAPAAPRRALLQLLQHYWNARGQDAAIPAAVPRTGLRQRPPRACPRTTTGRPTTMPLPSKPLLFEHRTRHDTKTHQDGRQLHALLAIPPHVGE
jgi:hypothetical protein